MDRFDNWLPLEMLSITSSLLNISHRQKARRGGLFLPYTIPELMYIRGTYGYGEEDIELALTCDATWSENTKQGDDPDGYIYTEPEGYQIDPSYLIDHIYELRDTLGEREWDIAMHNLGNVLYRLDVPHYEYFHRHNAINYMKGVTTYDMQYRHIILNALTHHV